MRAEISKLYNRLKTRTICIAHDQTEAMTMASRKMEPEVLKSMGSEKCIHFLPGSEQGVDLKILDKIIDISVNGSNGAGGGEGSGEGSSAKSKEVDDSCEGLRLERGHKG